MSVDAWEYIQQFALSTVIISTWLSLHPGLYSALVRKYRNKKTKFLRNYSVEIWKYFRLINLAEIDQLQLLQHGKNTL